MNSLKNKTLFVSGASRGIGLAIAKKAAADGANVILAAKTAEPHPKLPGTIYTAAAEIEEVEQDRQTGFWIHNERTLNSWGKGLLRVD